MIHPEEINTARREAFESLGELMRAITTTAAHRDALNHARAILGGNHPKTREIESHGQAVAELARLAVQRSRAASEHLETLLSKAKGGRQR